MSKLKVTNLRNIGLSCGVMILSTAGILHTFLGGGWSKKTGEAAKRPEPEDAQNNGAD